MPIAGRSTGAAKLGQCNCELCSESEGKSTKTLTKPSRLPRPDTSDCDDPCQRKRTDIIRRNKLAVKILSKQVKAEKKKSKRCDSRYDSVRLFPTAHHAMRWPAAYSLARSSSTNFVSDKRKRKRKLPAKESLSPDREDCACELMARAIRAELHHHLGLTEHRDRVNEGCDPTPPPEPQTEPEPKLDNK